MSISRLLTVFAASALAQKSQDIDLCGTMPHCKKLNITGNNTVQLAYSVDFPEGDEGVEKYASCVTDSQFKKILTNMTFKDDVKTTSLSCNTTAFFSLKNTSLVVKTQTTISPKQCEQFENNSWSIIYNCIKHVDLQAREFNSTDTKGNTLTFWEFLGVLAAVGVVGGLVGLLGVACRGGCNTDRSDSEPSLRTPH